VQLGFLPTIPDMRVSQISKSMKLARKRAFESAVSVCNCYTG
jgi:hypothetical protein